MYMAQCVCERKTGRETGIDAHTAAVYAPPPRLCLSRYTREVTTEYLDLWSCAPYTSPGSI